jgi:hypothetical protein
MKARNAVTVHLTPKQRVLKAYPNAVCEENGPYHQIVSIGKWAKARVLGMSLSGPKGAWYIAAFKLDTHPTQD